MAESATKVIEVQMPVAPQVLKDLVESKGDINAVGKIITENKELSLEVLETINAPFFALVRQIKSADEAVRMLGIARIFNLTTGRLLRTNVFNEKDKKQKELWGTSTKVAVISVLVAKELDLAPTDEAYASAMFHNAGMAILANMYPDYWKLVVNYYNDETGNIEAIEKAAVGTCHAKVSSDLASNWGLSGNIINTIALHHSPELINKRLGNKTDLSDLLITLKISEQIARLPGYLASCTHNYEWELIKESCFDYLNITEGMFKRIEIGIKKKLSDIKY